MKKRTWIIIVVIIAICGGGAFLMSRLAAGAVAAQVADVETGTVMRTTLSSAVESSGSIAAREDLALAFGTSGTVAQVNFDVGDQVKAGDVLAKLDTTDLELQVAQSEQAHLIQQANYSTTIQPDEAALNSAQASVDSAYAAYLAAKEKFDLSGDQITVGCANLENAKDALDDAQGAYDNVANFWKTAEYAPFSPQKTRLDQAQNNYAVALASCNITRNDINDSTVRSAYAQLEQARLNLANLTPRAEKITTAQAQVEQARLALEQARLQLTHASIVAPFDGLITRINVKAGTLNGATSAIEIADISQYKVDVLIDEIEIALVAPGQKVEVTLDALPETTLSGVVDHIDPAGTINQGVVNYNVSIVLDPSAATLRLDMTANVRILGDTHANVLAVPTEAIRADSDGTFIMVPSASGPQRVTVTLGFGDDTLTEVSGDLQEGMTIYVGDPTPPANNPFSGPFGGQG